MASTRARKRLFISAAGTRRRKGQILEASPSPFSDELPGETGIPSERRGRNPGGCRTYPTCGDEDTPSGDEDTCGHLRHRSRTCE